MKNKLLGLLLPLLLLSCKSEQKENPVLFQGKEVEASVFLKKTTAYLGQELQASLDALGTPENTPDSLFGEPQGGQFANASWAQTLMRYSILSGQPRLGKHELLPWIHAYLLKEARGGGPTFAQLFTVSTLYLSCKVKNDLSTSDLWKSFTPEEQQLLIDYVDVRLFWNEAEESVGGRANNYFGVALHIHAYCVALNIAKDPGTYGKLMEKNMSFIRRYNGFLDDSNQFNRAYDRYLHEYIRFIWESAELAGDEKTLAELAPYIRPVARLWWDLYSPERGHSSPWGRSRQNSWDDTFEQSAFFATHPDISPAPVADMAAAFVNSWNRYFTNEYNAERHLNRMLDEGRGAYGYAGRDRIWSYTIGTLSKIMGAMLTLKEAIEANGLKVLATKPTLTDHSRIVYYAEPHYGVWTLRSGSLNVAVPFVGNGASTDYLPIPYGYPGIEAPVQRFLPTLVPYFKTANGDAYTVCNGAESAQLEGASGVQLTWTDLQTLKGATSGLEVAVTSLWNATPEKLTLMMTFTPARDVDFTGIDFWIPLNATGSSSKVAVNTSWPATVSEITEFDRKTYNGGAFAPIDKIICYNGEPFRFEKGKTYELSMELEVKIR